MANVIFKLVHRGVERYFMWTTVGQGPATTGMTLEQLREFYLEEYGAEGLEKLESDRLPRVEQTGCSSFVNKAQDLLRYSYEDDWGHRPITIDELWDRYVEGDLCESCFRGRTRAEFQNEDNPGVCVYCDKDIQNEDWTVVLDMPDNIVTNSREYVPLFDVRADPAHPRRQDAWTLAQYLFNAHLKEQLSERAKERLRRAIDRARKELT